jgi:DNA-directed RNA polymerase specialized sigma subunit
MRGALAKAFAESSASDIEIHVIVQHFLENRTLREIAAELPERLGQPRLSRQRIFQIKNAALARLKTSLARQGIRGLE